MAIEQFANNPISTLNGLITSGATTLILNTVTGFSTSPQFRLLIENEILLVTGVSGNTFTVTRGAEGSTAASHASGTTVYQVVTAGALVAFGTVYPTIPQARLTLTSGVPVLTSDVASATTIYYTPYEGNRVDLYSGTAWVSYGITELSLALGTLTSDKNYDVFCYANSGVPTLELSAAWTNGTTRADAITQQDGVDCKSGALTRRLVGTIRTISTTATCFTFQLAANAGGANSQVYVANRYNRRPVRAQRSDSTVSWTYNSSTIRQARASSSNRIEYIQCAADYGVSAVVKSLASNNSGTVDTVVGVGVDSTSANSAQYYGSNAAASGIAVSLGAIYDGNPGIGYHALNWLEWIPTNTGTTTYYSGSAAVVSGMRAEVWA